MCHDAFRAVVAALMQALHVNLTAVQLVDSHLVTGPQKYLSALLMCLTSMLHLELPHVNVLSKVREGIA
jgi:GPN-loop GTPase